MGKVNFGYILGWSVLSMLALNWLVNLLAGPAQVRALRLVLLRVTSSLTASAQGLELYRCGSLLGYSMLPIVLFSAAAVFLPARRVRSHGVSTCFLAHSSARRTQRLHRLLARPARDVVVHAHGVVAAHLHRAIAGGALL
jgi:hypothetical protein